MNLLLLADTWSELRRYIISTDLQDAADSVVGLLLDNNINITEIKEAFADDDEIKRSLSGYLDDQELDQEDMTYEDEDDDDDYY